MAPSGTLFQIVAIHEDPVLSILPILKGSFISGGVDRMICLITNDVSQGNSAVKFLDHFQNKTITSLVAITDEVFASSSIDGTIKVMNLTNNALEVSLTTAKNSPVNCIDYDPISKMIYAAEESGNISQWNLNNDDMNYGKEVKTFKGHSKRVLQVKVVHSDNIASSSLDKTLRIWNIATTTEVIKIDCASLVRTICRFNEMCLTYGDEEGDITVYNIKKKASEGVVKAHTGICHHIIQLNQDVNSFCSCGEDKSIVFLNLKKRKKTGEIKDAHFERILSIAQLINGEIVSSSMDQMMKIWNIKY